MTDSTTDPGRTGDGTTDKKHPDRNVRAAHHILSEIDLAGDGGTRGRNSDGSGSSTDASGRQDSPRVTRAFLQFANDHFEQDGTLPGLRIAGDKMPYRHNAGADIAFAGTDRSRDARTGTNSDGCNDQNGGFFDRIIQRLETANAQHTAAKYGLQADVSHKNGDTSFNFYYTDRQGNRHDVLSTKDGNFDQQLKGLQESRISQLENQYHVTISRDGQNAVVGAEGSRPVGAPSFAQLDALGQALQQSAPAQLTKDGGPLRILFPKDRVGQGDAAYYTRVNNESTLVFEPMSGNPDISGTAAVLRHELAHNGDDQTHSGPNGDARQKKFYEQLGYVDIGDGRWAVKTKDGSLYYQNPDKNQNPKYPFGDWTRVDKHGKPLDPPGNPTTELTTRELRAQALVPPRTDYFPNPAEFQAEGFKDFRGGRANRSAVYYSSPELYQTLKEEDQRQINSYYPPGRDGQPKYIRNPDGQLVPNTEENRQEVKIFEDSLSLVGNLGGGIKNHQ